MVQSNVRREARSHPASPLGKLGYHPSDGHFESREQRCDAMPLVVMAVIHQSPSDWQFQITPGRLLRLDCVTEGRIRAGAEQLRNSI
jgi:hypothetical protein